MGKGTGNRYSEEFKQGAINWYWETGRALQKYTRDGQNAKVKSTLPKVRIEKPNKGCSKASATGKHSAQVEDIDFAVIKRCAWRFW